jgi:PleD family two-component response regulator
VERELFRATPPLLPLISEFIDDRGFPKILSAATTEIVLTLLTGMRVTTLQAQRRRLVQFAITDGLTGLLNSNHFPGRLEHETAMARRFGSSLSVIFLDLDHFKSVNDRFGHQTGSALWSKNPEEEPRGHRSLRER